MYEQHYFRYVRNWPDRFEIMPMPSSALKAPITIAHNLN